MLFNIDQTLLPMANETAYTTALKKDGTVEGESYSAAEVSYYYHNAYNSIVNSNYASLYGIDKNTSLSQQSLNDTAKMLLGVSEDMTWDACIMTPPWKTAPPAILS